ncbi:MAG: ZmpA/ZmpB/ZmpC family metallo-endopeptidase-related protein, partial [Oscillospiraceae bacterium]
MATKKSFKIITVIIPLLLSFVFLGIDGSTLFAATKTTKLPVLQLSDNTYIEFSKISNDLAGSYEIIEDFTYNGGSLGNFTGTIEGNGHCISSKNPLFSSVSGTIKNLGVKDSLFNSKSGVTSGAITNVLTGTLQNCYSSSINNPIVGENNGTLTNSYEAYVPPKNGSNTKDATFILATRMNLEAFAYLLNKNSGADMKFCGKNNSLPLGIGNSSKIPPTSSPFLQNNTFILSDQYDLVALSLLCGLDSKYLTYAYALEKDIAASSAFSTISGDFTGNIEGNDFTIKGIKTPLFDSIKGGIIQNLGFENAKISQKDTEACGVLANNTNGTTINGCYSEGNLTGKVAGGLVGNAYNTAFVGCYTSGNVIGETAGGIVGESSHGKFENSYSVVGVNGNSGFSGGFVGNDEYGRFENCYAAGGVSGGKYSGGFLGISESSNFYNTFCSSSNSHKIGKSSNTDEDSLTSQTLASMKKSKFAAKLNGVPEVFGWKSSVNSSLPVISGLGDGKNIPVITLTTSKFTLMPPKNGTLTAVEKDEPTPVLVTGTSYNFLEDTEIVCTATPDYGYELEKYSVNGKDFSKNTKTFTIKAETELSAIFKEKPMVEVNIKSNEGGTVTPNGISKVEMGGNLTFSVIPNSGYILKEIKCGTKKLSKYGYDYTVKNVSKKCDVEVIFESKDVDVDKVSAGTDGIVVNVKSQNAIPGQVDDNIGNTIRTEMPKNGMIKGDVLDEIRGKDVDVVFEGKDFIWKINGKNVYYGRNNNVNLMVNIGKSTKAIAEKTLKPIAKYKNQVQFQLEHDGAFPFSGDLSVNVGKDNANRYANLFYSNPKTEQLDLIGCSIIDEFGFAKYGMWHASDYVIV